jgi:CRP-like cAMP-binding protein
MLGKLYRDGEVIVRQGEVGNCMYVILEGKVEVAVDNQERNVRVATRGEQEFFGEMAIFERQVRSATVRALGDARILTIDRRNLLRAIDEDPSMVFRLTQGMANRVRNLTNEVVQLRLKDRREHERMTISTNVWLKKKEEQATLQTLRNISNSGPPGRELIH